MTSGAPAVLPGSPAAVRQRAVDARRTGHRLAAAATEVRRLTRPTPLWSGQAAQAYRASLGDLPPRLDEAAAAFAAAAAVLEAWAEQLAGLQQRAAALDREQRAARTTADPAAVLVRAVEADRALARLLDEVQGAAAGAALALEHAASAAPPAPSLLRRAVAALVTAVEQAQAGTARWLEEHADDLDAVADALGTVSLVLAVGALAVAPLGLVGGAGLLAAGTAVGGAGALARYGAWAGGGDASGLHVALDAVTAGTAGAALRVGRAAGRVPAALFLARAPAAVPPAPGPSARLVLASDRALTGLGAVRATAGALPPPRRGTAPPVRAAWPLAPGAAVLHPSGGPLPLHGLRPVPAVQGPGLPGRAP